MSRSSRNRRVIRPRPLEIRLTQPDKSAGQKAFGWLGRFFMMIGIIFFLGSLLNIYIFFSLIHNGGKAMDGLPVVLTYHFHTSLPEKTDPLERLFTPSPVLSLSEIGDQIKAAAEHPDVKALAVRISPGSYSLAQLEDLAAALEDFHAAGKTSYAFSDSIGEAGGGMDDYYLAGLFQNIWVQPVGTIGITGFGAEGLYFGDALARLNIQPQFFRREEFKSAMEPFTRPDMSGESRAELTKIMQGIQEYYIMSLSERRNIEPAVLKQAIETAPLAAEQAAQTGLISQTGYLDQFLNMLEERYGLSGDGKGFQSLAAMRPYKKGKKPGADQAVKIAKIIMEGPILAGSSDEGGFSPFSQDEAVLSFDYANAILDAANDPDIKAILIRINSPGGSPVASETIHRAMRYAIEAREKPVIVSMGAVAASGGYWIASAADEIIAAPTTITGSIGVVSGKFALGNALLAYGINPEAIILNENADLYSPFRPFDAAGAETINKMIDDIYDSFIQRVASGRNMSEADVRALAGGRIYTGIQAEEVGLVDMIGGIKEAESALAARLDIDPARIVYADYPDEPSPFGALAGLFGGDLIRVLTAINQQIAALVSHYKVQAAPVQVYENFSF